MVKLYIIIKGLSDICQKLEEGTYSLLGKDNTMKFSLSKKPILFKDQIATLLILREYSSVEKLQEKIVENKCKELLISTITHDIKTPLTIIQANLSLLKEFVHEEGKQHYESVCCGTERLEYFVYDIKVIKKDIFRT
jgi:K+-sensing histidine kinase KdpD